MKTRIISAIIGIVLCIVLLIFGDINSIVISIALSIVTGILCGELLTAKGLHRNLKVSIPCVAFGVLMPLLANTLLNFMPMYIFTVVLFAIMIVFHDTIKFDDVMFAFAGTTLITLSMTSFAITACSANKYTAFWCVLILAVPWMADSGAYFAGYYLGKHKLCPTISPKKTVEGAVGGLLSGFLSSLLIGLVFMLIYSESKINFTALIIIGLVNPLISIMGDLTFSIIKRACGIKDYGSIMPGHGGLLDRFDSIIFSAPFVFIVSQFMTIIS